MASFLRWCLLLSGGFLLGRAVPIFVSGGPENERWEFFSKPFRVVFYDPVLNGGALPAPWGAVVLLGAAVLVVGLLITHWRRDQRRF